jgi:hypothetical protein
LLLTACERPCGGSADGVGISAPMAQPRDAQPRELLALAPHNRHRGLPDEIVNV